MSDKLASRVDELQRKKQEEKRKGLKFKSKVLRDIKMKMKKSYHFK